MKFSVPAALILVLDGALAFTSQSTLTRAPTTLGVVVDGRTMENDVTPANNFVLVKLPDDVESTAGGLLLTGKAKLKRTEGTVVSTGPGKIHHETGATFDMPVKPGENVVYGKYDGTEINIDGAKHYLIRDDDILLKFTGEELKLETADVVRDTILVETEKKEAESEVGILIAQTSQNKNKATTGKVIKVGPGRYATNGERMDMEVEAGDFVKFRDFAGTEVEIDGKDYSVVRMIDLLAKF